MPFWSNVRAVLQGAQLAVSVTRSLHVGGQNGGCIVQLKIDLSRDCVGFNRDQCVGIVHTVVVIIVVVACDEGHSTEAERCQHHCFEYLFHFHRFCFLSGFKLLK